ncbi:DUF4179 domain-containing protein [Bacillus manliponensis]|uniref:DUF4179 domain-containing protein n=1 Tax=Bacillus manliponensis TaxID=574376 RepID=UPI003514E09F
MNDKFERELEQLFNEKQEMPDVVRESVNRSYDMIRANTKKKKRNKVWKQVAVAACSVIVAGGLFTNEQVRASIIELFQFNDKGIERAVEEGFTEESNSVVTDQGVTVALEQYFADEHKLGFSFKIAFEDKSVLQKPVRQVSFDYRLKNGDGEYILENIPDTKPLKGTPSKYYISGGNDKLVFLDKKIGKVQYEEINESELGNIPQLKGAVLEIESVNVFYEDDEMKKIDGVWNLPIEDSAKQGSGKRLEYEAFQTSPQLKLVSAKASPTSFNIAFSVDEIVEDENEFIDMKVIDNKGNEYKSSDGYSTDVKGGKTIIYANFPITSYEKLGSITLKTKNFGEIKLKRK